MSEKAYPEPLAGWTTIGGPDDEKGMHGAIRLWQGNPPRISTTRFALLVRQKRSGDGGAAYVVSNSWECGAFPPTELEQKARDVGAVDVADRMVREGRSGEVLVLISDGLEFEPKWLRTIAPHRP